MSKLEKLADYFAEKLAAVTVVPKKRPKWWYVAGNTGYMTEQEAKALAQKLSAEYPDGEFSIVPERGVAPVEDWD